MCKRFGLALLSHLGFFILLGMHGITKGAAYLPYENLNYGWIVYRKWSDPYFSWGCLITQIPGGFLASKYPANRVFGTAIAVSACVTALLPLAAKLHSTVYFGVRLLQGLAEGVTYPAIYGVWRHWAPPMERSILTTFAYSGIFASELLNWNVASYLTRRLGWQAVFYLYGAAGIVWFIFWMRLSFETPSSHPTISRKELNYIENAMGQVSLSPITFRSIPWKSIFTSMPVYAIIVAHFCYSWTYSLLIYAPVYFRHYYSTDISKYKLNFHCLMLTVMVPIGGLLADLFRRCLTATSVRKLFNCGGFGMETTFLLMIVMYTKLHMEETLAVVGAIFSSCFAFSGFHVNHLDIAPRYASILMGISNSVAILSSWICNRVIKSLSEERGSRDERWRQVFLIASSLHLAGFMFYALYASGEKQPWAEPPPEDDDGRPACQARDLP